MSHLVEVCLSRILLDDTRDQQWIHLQEKAGPRSFQIVIGSFEAREIERKVKSLDPPRPMTHDLARQLIHALGARIEKVVVDELRDATFFAKIYLKHGSNEIVVDARPSDAIALAIAEGSAILVSDEIFAAAQSDSDTRVDPQSGSETEP